MAFGPALKFAQETRSSHVGDSTEVDSSLASKYQTRVEVIESDKYSSLLRYGINCRCKNFIMQGQGLSIGSGALTGE